MLIPAARIARKAPTPAVLTTDQAAESPDEVAVRSAGRADSAALRTTPKAPTAAAPRRPKSCRAIEATCVSGPVTQGGRACQAAATLPTAPLAVAVTLAQADWSFDWTVATAAVTGAAISANLADTTLRTCAAQLETWLPVACRRP